MKGPFQKKNLLMVLADLIGQELLVKYKRN